MKNQITIQGLIIGAILATSKIICFLFPLFAFIESVSFILTVILVTLFGKSYDRMIKADQFKYKNAFIYSIKVFLIAYAISFIIQICLILFTDMLAVQTEESIEVLRAAGVPDSQIQLSVSMATKPFTIGYSFISYMLSATIGAAIAAIFSKRK